MKTMNSIRAEIQNDRAAAFSQRRALQNAAQIIVDTYRETRDGNPAATVDSVIAAVGYDTAAVIIASAVNASAWDGRISTESKEWADSVSGSYDEEAARWAGITLDGIHRAHLDQLARAMSKATRPAPEQEPEQEPAAVKKITLYIGLNDKDTKTQIIPTAEAVSIVTGIIYERTSGATIYRARGIYTHDNGEKVTEETLRVELFGEEPENVKAAAQQIKTALNQESISYQEETVNSYFI